MSAPLSTLLSRLSKLSTPGKPLQAFASLAYQAYLAHGWVDFVGGVGSSGVNWTRKALVLRHLSYPPPRRRLPGPLVETKTVVDGKQRDQIEFGDLRFPRHGAGLPWRV